MQERERAVQADSVADEAGPALPAASAHEKLLVARLLDGDEAAFRDLVARHNGGLVRLARTFVSSPSVADEVVQETWLAVLRGLPRFEGRSTLKTWIYRILTNLARTRGVREARSFPFSSFEAGDDEPAVQPERFRADGRWASPPHNWPADTPEQIAGHRQAMSSLEQALEALPERQRVVVRLRDIEGLEAAEVCGVLGISEANQRVLLHRGRTKLRDAIEHAFDPR